MPDMVNGLKWRRQLWINRVKIRGEKTMIEQVDIPYFIKDTHKQWLKKII